MRHGSVSDLPTTLLSSQPSRTLCYLTPFAVSALQQGSFQKRQTTTRRISSPSPHSPVHGPTPSQTGQRVNECLQGRSSLGPVVHKNVLTYEVRLSACEDQGSMSTVD